MVFRENDVQARRGERQVTVPYGQLVNLGMVQFAVRARPGVSTAILGMRPRETVIDGVVAGLLVTRREATDVIDVRYIAEDPRTAQRIVNSTVHAFQALNVQWARERSRRRREFLAEQLSRTDSALARAQAELAAFRSRQQLASSQTAIEQRQSALIQIESQPEQLDADRRTFTTLIGPAEDQRRGHARRGDTRARNLHRDRRQPRDRRLVPAAPELPGASGFDDHRPLEGRGN